MKRFRKLIIVGLLLTFVATAFAASTYTTYLNLQKAGRGTANWDTIQNNNWDLVDAAYHTMNATITTAIATLTGLYNAMYAMVLSLQSDVVQLWLLYSDVHNSLTDLPEVYQLPGTFNGTAGVTITLPKAVTATDDYHINIQPTSYSGTDIADIKVYNGLSSFTVYSEGNNAVDTFIATVHYETDLATYGNQVFRRWIVSPDASITDHSAATVPGSLAYILTAINGAYSEIIFPAAHSYSLGWSQSYASISLGAVFNAAAKTLTKTGEDFKNVSLLRDNMPVHISGTASNDGYYTLADVDPEVLTFNETIVNETTAGTIVVQLAIPNNVTLVFDHKAMLDDNSTGYDLWIDGQIVAPRTQIFDWSGELHITEPQKTNLFPEWAGAVCNNMAVDSAVAVNKLTAGLEYWEGASVPGKQYGGGIVDFGACTYYAVTEPFYMRPQLSFHGNGRYSTILKMADAVNLDAVIMSSNWDAMIAAPGVDGQGAWMALTEGVHYGYAIRNLQVHGNRFVTDPIGSLAGTPNNTTGWGMKLYGHGFSLTDLLVTLAAEGGIWTQCGKTVGQKDMRDMPEGMWENIWGRMNGGFGWKMFGPHDAFMDNIILSHNDREGMFIGMGAKYNGSCDINFMHTYGNDWDLKIAGGHPEKGGLVADTSFKGVHLQLEDGLYLSRKMDDNAENPGTGDAYGSANGTVIGILHITYGTLLNHPACHLDAPNLKIDHIKMGLKADNVNNPTGILLTTEASKCKFGSITYYSGSEHQNIALDVNSGSNQFGQVTLQQNASADTDWEADYEFYVGEMVDPITPCVPAVIFSLTDTIPTGGTSGESGAVEPTWDCTVGNTTNDNELQWTAITRQPCATAIRMSNDNPTGADRNRFAYVNASGFLTYFNYVVAGVDNYIRMFAPLTDGLGTLYTGVAPSDSDDFFLESLYGTDREIVSWQRKYQAATVAVDPLWVNKAESGRHFTNSGATAVIGVHIPACTADAPLTYTFTVTTEIVGNDFNIDPNGTDTVLGGGAGKYLILDTLGESATLNCYEAGVWAITASHGTLTYQP